jgi:hypothetical protein
MALTELQRANVRRHLGYGPVGNLPNQASFSGYRFFVQQGLMEFRLSNLSASEELILLGATGSPNPPSPVSPNYTDLDDTNVYDGYLQICNRLEGVVATATGNLDTDKAGDWTARKQEIPHRIYLYNIWCQRMAQFLYIPMGRGTPTARGSFAGAGICIA